MAKVFPLADALDFKVDPDMYRVVVGVTELICGIMLALIPGRLLFNMVTYRYCMSRC